MPVSVSVCDAAKPHTDTARVPGPPGRDRRRPALRLHVTDPDKRSFLFLLGSHRPEGNAETLAREAALQLAPDSTQRWLRLRDLPLPRFEDHRHLADHPSEPPVGNERLLLEATVEATDLVIVSPLYWYAVSADTKLYLDYWSAWLRLPEVAFRSRMAGGTLWGITVTSHLDDDSKVDPLIGTLRNTAEYMGMSWGGTLIGHGNRPGDVLADTDALTAAKSFFGQPVAVL